jgi:outer membrane biogenesis lipoprotein LolB
MQILLQTMFNLLNRKTELFFLALFFSIAIIACQSKTDVKASKNDSTFVVEKQHQEDSLDAEDMKELAPIVGAVAK